MESILDFLVNYYSSIAVICVSLAFFMLVTGFSVVSTNVFRGTSSVLIATTIIVFLASVFVLGLSFYTTTQEREVKVGEVKAVNFSNISFENEKVEYKQNHFLVFKKGTVSSTKTKTEKTFVKVFVGTKDEGYAFQNIPIERVRFSPVKKGEKPFVTVRASMDVQKECRRNMESCEAVVLNIPEESFPPEEFSVPTIKEAGN